MGRAKLMTNLEREKRINIIIPYLKKDWKILDCACGDGWLTKSLNEKGFDCVGIDKELQKHGDKFFQFNVLKMPFKDDAFDCVISIQTLEHVLCEKEISRVLKKDRLLLAEVPRWDLPFKILDMFGLIQAGIKEHIRVVDFDNFRPFSKLRSFSTGCGLCKFGIFRNTK
jgi:SAM-dependent methyltransferase